MLQFWCNCARTVPKLRRAGLFERLAFLLLIIFEFASRIAQITRCHDVIAIKYATRLVTADAHGNALAHASAQHVAHRCSAQIVEDQTFVFQFIAGPITSTIRAVFVGIHSLVAVRTH